MSSQNLSSNELARALEIARAGEISRRSFLLNRALGAAATTLPGIIILTPQSPDAAADDEKSKPKAKPSDGGVAEYTLHAVSKKAAPDGRTRDVFCYDGKIPGPVVRAKLGQKLKIRVVNDLAVPTSIHWHGMHQPGTWQMDGVDGVSHEPIPPGKEFTYKFAATPAGTHWYHSHEWHVVLPNSFQHFTFELVPGFHHSIVLLLPAFPLPRFKAIGSIGHSMRGDSVEQLAVETLAVS